MNSSLVGEDVAAMYIEDVSGFEKDDGCDICWLLGSSGEHYIAVGTDIGLAHFFELRSPIDEGRDSLRCSSAPLQ